MPYGFYGPLDPRSWVRNDRSSLAAPLVGRGLTDPLGAYIKTTQMMADEGQRAYDLARGRGGHVDTIYDAERHARAGYRSAQDIGLIPTMAGGVVNEAGPLSAATYRMLKGGGDRPGPAIGEFGHALSAAGMDLHNNNVGLREAAAGRQVPTRDTPDLRRTR